MSEVKLPDEVKQNNLPPEYGQPIEVGETKVTLAQANRHSI
jgi:hypothetical protein